MEDSKKKICLSIAGLDPAGGAGVIADIKTFSAFGCFATSVITSITFQNTQGVFGAEHQTPESVRKQINPIVDDFELSALKTGMLPTIAIIEEVAEIIRASKLKNLVVDPVVRSTTGFDLIDDQALSSLIKNLFPLSTVVTPNIPEAERISKIKIKNDRDIIESAKIIRGLGAKNVLIKGGHLKDSEFKNQTLSTQENKKRTARDFLFVDEKLEIFEMDFIETTATHGTGCTLAAAITANLALGKNLPEAVHISKDFVNKAIKNAPNIGKGHSPIGI